MKRHNYKIGAKIFHDKREKAYITVTRNGNENYFFYDINPSKDHNWACQEAKKDKKSWDKYYNV